MVHSLEMPDAFAGLSIERKQRIGKEIVTYAIAAIEVEDGRTGGHIHDAAFGIDRHAGPVVCGAGILPGVFGPGVIAEFARMRDGVKGPAHSAGVHIEGADVTRRRGMGFGILSAHDDQVFVNRSRRAERNRLLLVGFAQAFA